MSKTNSILTQEILREYLNYDLESGLFFWRKNISNIKAGQQTGCVGVNGYVHIRIFRKLHLAHRLAWLYCYGDLPLIVDHKNGNKQDNRIANLRESSKVLNGQNRHSAQSNNLTSGLLGVAWHPNIKRFIAHINVDGRRKHLGTFTDKNKAHDVYLKAKRELHEACTI